MISVITTINYPTEAVKVLAKRDVLIVIGDKKTPKDWMKTAPPNCVFLNGEYSLDYSLAKLIPDNHYSRKNLGYLTAIYNKAKVIYDTDDDNIPNENWKERTVDVNKALESEGQGWYNVFDLFGDDFGNYIWPRGFSLKQLRHTTRHGRIKSFASSSIQQGLSDGEPDVDAIWRLVNCDRGSFNEELSIYLHPGAWCPFNSQSTWWFPKAYPLMYLPVTASFRMTDIWRSFVAQRCLWEMGEGVTFHSPAEVFQDRNKHDLLKDFEQEIPGYLLNDKIVEILSGLTLNGDVFSNLFDCYKALVNNGIYPQEELQSVYHWIKDLEKIYAKS